jgi:hypothetical protein
MTQRITDLISAALIATLAVLSCSVMAAGI